MSMYVHALLLGPLSSEGQQYFNMENCGVILWVPCGLPFTCDSSGTHSYMDDPRLSMTLSLAYLIFFFMVCLAFIVLHGYEIHVCVSMQARQYWTVPTCENKNKPTRPHGVAWAGWSPPPSTAILYKLGHGHRLHCTGFVFIFIFVVFAFLSSNRWFLKGLFAFFSWTLKIKFWHFYPVIR